MSYLLFLIIGGILLYKSQQKTRQQSDELEKEIVREFKSSNLTDTFTKIESIKYNDKDSSFSKTRLLSPEDFRGELSRSKLIYNIVSFLNASNPTPQQKEQSLKKVLSLFASSPQESKKYLLILWSHPKITGDDEFFSEIINLTSYLPTTKDEFIQKAEQLIEDDKLGTYVQSIDELSTKGQFKKIKVASEFVISEKSANNQSLDPFLERFFDSQSNPLIRKEIIFHLSLFDRLKAKKLEYKYLNGE